YEGDEIESLPALDTLLADLDRAQLQALLVGLAEHDPAIGASIERQVALLRLASAAPQASGAGASARRSPIDQESIRRQVRAAMRAVERDQDDYDYYDDEDDAGEEIVAAVRPVLEQGRRFVEGGDARSAVAIFEAITDEYLGSYRSLRDDFEE